jgi:hypothetical protein
MTKGPNLNVGSGNFNSYGMKILFLTETLLSAMAIQRLVFNNSLFKLNAHTTHKSPTNR